MVLCWFSVRVLLNEVVFCSQKRSQTAVQNDCVIPRNRIKNYQKKGNPKSTLRTESRRFSLLLTRFLNVVANESKGVGALLAKEPLSHSGAQSASR